MKTEQEILKRIDEIVKDGRLQQPTATVFINAPLALIQMSMTAELHSLQWVLGIERSKIPLKK